MAIEVEGQKRYSVEVAIARKLNSANENVRKKALSDMTKLVKKSELTEIQFLKLWKGLYYMVYITDKPIVQEEVNTQIAKITLACQGYEQSYLYLKSFFQIMEKQWDFIDQYRVDKYYSLIRKMLNNAFVVLNRFADEDIEEREMAVTELVSVLKTSVLHPLNVKTNGIVLHVSDIFLEELYKVTQGNVLRSLSKLLLPFINFLCKSDDQVTHRRIKERVFFRLVSTYSPFERKDAYTLPKEGIEYEGEDSLVNKELFPTDFLVLSKLFFKCASSKTTLEENRSSLYSLCKSFKKAEEQVKELESFLPFLPGADELNNQEEEEEEVEGEEQDDEDVIEEDEDEDEDDEDELDQPDVDDEELVEDDDEEDDDEVFEDNDSDLGDADFDDEEFDDDEDEEFDDEEEEEEEEEIIPIKQSKNTKQQPQQQPKQQPKAKQQQTKQQQPTKTTTKVSKTPTPTKIVSKPAPKAAPVVKKSQTPTKTVSKASPKAAPKRK